MLSYACSHDPAIDFAHLIEHHQRIDAGPFVVELTLYLQLDCFRQSATVLDVEPIHFAWRFPVLVKHRFRVSGSAAIGRKDKSLRIDGSKPAQGLPQFVTLAVVAENRYRINP